MLPFATTTSALTLLVLAAALRVSAAEGELSPTPFASTTEEPPAQPCQVGAQVFAHGNYVQQSTLGRSAYFKGTITAVNGAFMDVEYTLDGETRLLRNLPEFKVFDNQESGAQALAQGDDVFAHGMGAPPSELDCTKSSDTCLAAQLGWDAHETCFDSAKKYCADPKWSTDIIRCCPSACASLNTSLATAPCTTGVPTPAPAAADTYHMAQVLAVGNDRLISTLYWNGLLKSFPADSTGVSKRGRSCAATATTTPVCNAPGPSDKVFALFQAQPGHTSEDGAGGTAFYSARYHEGSIVGEPRSDGLVRVAWSNNIGTHLVPNTQVFSHDLNQKQLDMSKWALGAPVFAPQDGTRWYMGTVAQRHSDTTVMVSWMDDSAQDAFTQGKMYDTGATEDLFSRAVSCAGTEPTYSPPTTTTPRTTTSPGPTHNVVTTGECSTVTAIAAAFAEEWPSDSTDYSDKVFTGSSDIEVFGDSGSEQSFVALQYNNLEIPAGSVVKSASIEFKVKEHPSSTYAEHGALGVRIQAEKSPSAALSVGAAVASNGWTGTPGDLTRRADSTTGTEASWAIPATNATGAITTGDLVATSDFSAVVQSLVDGASWDAVSNKPTFLLSRMPGAGAGTRTFESEDHMPRLTIQFCKAPPPTPQPCSVSLAEQQAASLAAIETTMQAAADAMEDMVAQMGTVNMDTGALQAASAQLQEQIEVEGCTQPL